MKEKLIVTVLILTGAALSTAARADVSQVQFVNIESLSCQRIGALPDLMKAAVAFNCGLDESASVSLVVSSATRQVQYTENNPVSPAEFSEAEQPGSYSVKARVSCTNLISGQTLTVSSPYKNILCP